MVALHYSAVNCRIQYAKSIAAFNGRKPAGTVRKGEEQQECTETIVLSFRNGMTNRGTKNADNDGVDSLPPSTLQDGASLRAKVKLPDNVLLEE